MERFLCGRQAEDSVKVKAQIEQSLSPYKRVTKDALILKDVYVSANNFYPFSTRSPISNSICIYSVRGVQSTKKVEAI